MKKRNTMANAKMEGLRIVAPPIPSLALFPDDAGIVSPPGCYQVGTGI
jgi:hypothetical protein